MEKLQKSFNAKKWLFIASALTFFFVLEMAFIRFGIDRSSPKQQVLLSLIWGCFLISSILIAFSAQKDKIFRWITTCLWTVILILLVIHFIEMLFSNSVPQIILTGIFVGAEVFSIVVALLSIHKQLGKMQCLWDKKFLRLFPLLCMLLPVLVAMLISLFLDLSIFVTETPGIPFVLINAVLYTKEFVEMKGSAHVN